MTADAVLQTCGVCTGASAHCAQMCCLMCCGFPRVVPGQHGFPAPGPCRPPARCERRGPASGRTSALSTVVVVVIYPRHSKRLGPASAIKVADVSSSASLLRVTDALSRHREAGGSGEQAHFALAGVPGLCPVCSLRCHIKAPALIIAASAVTRVILFVSAQAAVNGKLK